MNNIPAHLQRMRSQHPDLTGDSDAYTFDSFPRKIPLSKLPGKRLHACLQWIKEFNLLRTNPEVTFDSDEDGQWLPQYYIGGGGHGRVGVYVKRDANGEIIDEIALKELQSCTHHSLLWPNSRELGLRRRLLTEAAVHSQLNQSQSENFVHLRDYKYFNQGVDNDRLYRDPQSVVDPKKGTEKWRFYLELAPYGDLYTLLWKYRYWNQYLPEAFLWHVFDSLAEAAVKMRDCSWADMPSLNRPPGPPDDTDRMIDYDIKPDNIFLSYPDHASNDHQQGKTTFGGSKKYDYPVIKLGDHGMNEWTGPADSGNPGTYTSGTSGFMPPEMLRYGAWWKPLRNANWNVRFSESNTLEPKERSSIHLTDREAGINLGYLKETPEMQSTRKTANFHYNEKLHVWAIGKVMYDLMTLSNRETYWKKSTVVRDEFIANGNHQLPDFDQIPFQPYSHNQRSPYSIELTNLVRDCLRPFWAERIDVAHMKNTTAFQMEQWDNKWVDGCEDIEPDKLASDRDVTHPKLIYRKNDINNMPRGRELFTAFAKDPNTTQEQVDESMRDYRALKDLIRHDPDWPGLMPKWDKDTERYVEHLDEQILRSYHRTWMNEQWGKQNKFREKWEIDFDTGGLKRGPPHTGGWPQYRNDDDDGNSDDDDDKDDGNSQDPYPPPPLYPRGHRWTPNRSPPRSVLAGPQQAAPLGSSPVGRQQSISPGIQQAISAVQGFTMRDSTTRDPTSQRPTSQRPSGQQPAGQQPTISPDLPRRGPRGGRSLSPRLPQPWRSPSPPAPAPPDPIDYITDPSDSEVEIAVRTFRNGRRVSHYRPKRKNLKDFNQEYVRRRRGDKVNAKAAPWLANGKSKFDEAIRRRRERHERRRRSYERRRDNLRRADVMNQQISEPLPDDRVPGTQSRVVRGPGIHRPNSWLHGWQGPGTQINPINIDPNTNLGINPQQNLGQPGPPQAPTPQPAPPQAAAPQPALPQPTQAPPQQAPLPPAPAPPRPALGQAAPKQPPDQVQLPPQPSHPVSPTNAPGPPNTSQSGSPCKPAISHQSRPP